MAFFLGCKKFIIADADAAKDGHGCLRDAGLVVVDVVCVIVVEVFVVPDPPLLLEAAFLAFLTATAPAGSGDAADASGFFLFLVVAVDARESKLVVFEIVFFSAGLDGAFVAVA